MESALSKVEIELGGEQRVLCASLLAAKLIDEGVGNDPLSQKAYHVVPILLHALLAHEGRDETPDDLAKLVGVSNMEYVAAKIAETQGETADPTTAPGQKTGPTPVPRTGTRSKRSRKSS